MTEDAGVPATVGPENLGRFVTGPNGLGVGRLEAVDGAVARVSYFRCPAPEPYIEHEMRLEELRSADLSVHTRVYLHDGGRWRIGRVDGVHPQRPGYYLIAFPNSQGEVLSETDFEVRWSEPIEDPFEILGARGGESPTVYEVRLAFLAGWHRQRSLSRGVEGLFLGAVELHDHQLTVVRRVADDSVRRYLLADEVGLGKTIEAGALVLQYLRQSSNARVMVIAPDHLRQQWIDELVERFHIDDFGSAWVGVEAHGDPDSWPDDPIDLLVVDEAHHLTRAGTGSIDALDRLATIAGNAKEVLLLSATPVRSNEVAFLDLLHLLDPVHYAREDLASFARRVELRDQLALTYQALTPDLDGFDLSLFADTLESIFPEDSELRTLLRAACECSDAERPEWISRTRAHLSETYRLHHRLLRTRRSVELNQTFRVRGRKRGRPFTLDVEDESDTLRAELLEAFRLHLVAREEAGDISRDLALDEFRTLGTSCGSMPQAVLAVAESESIAGEWLRENGRWWLDELHSSAELVTDRLADLIVDVALARTSGKVVVVSAFTEASSAVAAAVGHRRGEARVARHLATDSREQNADAVARWLTDDNCVVLVCDVSAEEGINLQAADLIIHLDLPWEAIRLEQRIGRCDRHAEQRSAPVASAVVIYGDQRYASEWFEFLADGCGVFDRSVSSLQHVLAATERAVQYEVLIKGPEAFTSDLSEHAESLRSEAQRVAAHDSLDAVEVDHSEANRELRTLDGDGAFAESMVRWFEGVGGKVRRPSPGVVEFSGKRRLQVPFSLEAGIAPWVNSALATHRPVAVERALPILRAGHGLVDLVAEFLGNDDRGVAYACFRPAKGHWPPTPIFRSDFLVLAGDHERLAERAGLLGVETWVRQVIEEALPPVVETIHLFSNGEEVTHPAATRPYSKASGDRNLGSRPEMFDRLTIGMDWEQLCIAIQPLARRVLDQRQSVRSRPASASALVRQQIVSRDRRLRARFAAGLDAEGNGQLGDLTEAVPEMLEVAIKTLGCGVTIIADPHRAGFVG